MDAQVRLLGPERLLMMAIELDHAPETVSSTIEALARDRLPSLCEMLRSAPQRSAVTRAGWRRALLPERIRALVDADPPDLDTLEIILSRIGPERAGILLDLLTEAESLATRRRLFARLVELGPDIGPEILRRLRDSRWFARRNMLALLGELEDWPPKWSPASLSTDPHPAVRREAHKLMLRVPELRDSAVSGLLQDDDRRAVTLGIAAATESCPPEAIDLLAALIRDESARPDIRVMAVRALAHSRHPAALAPLIEQARRGPGWRRTQLAEKTPLLLAALKGLALFPTPPRDVRKLLARAASSKDPEIRGCVTRTGAG